METTYEKNTRKTDTKATATPPDGGIDVLAELAGLKVDLKQQWRKLFDSEPPPFNQRYLELRVGHHIRELAHDGRRRETRRVLGLPADEVEGGARSKKSPTLANRWWAPGSSASGAARSTRSPLLADGFEWQGRRFKSLSAAVAHEITVAHWNGWRFFGLKQTGGVRRLRCAV